MAEDCTDGDYLGAYSRFFTEFNAKVKPHDQLPVSVSSYNVTKAELTGEIINITLQYLNKTQCPPCLQAHLVQQVVQETNSMCKKQPKDCGFKLEEKTYTSLKLMQAVVAKVNEICTRYLDNSRLALLPPPPSTPLPQVAAGGNKNYRRAMEDRYVVLYDLHTTFGIQNESIVNYYAVFDGHAGQDAAVYCATHLHQYLAESIYYPTNPESALYHAFVITDAQFAEKYKTQKVCGGTTAVSTLIKDDKLYVAWVGDSSAMLIKRDSVVQLVNPHTLHREDERQRIEDMGGTVMPAMGILRVNGELSVSRAIGDVRYKPYVTGTPEINCITLDGTEDFLVLATDGLTDYVDPEEILTILYHEIQRNPNGLKRAHHILIQWAKYADSRDNITVIVVLLTPASEIAARHKYVHPYYRRQVNDILEEMNSNDKPMQRDIEYAHNAITSNNLKQTMLSQDSYDNHRDEDILEASNGKHENGDGDYDYSDLGPETNVDTIDDVNTMPVRNLSYEFYKDNDEVVENDDDDDDDEDDDDDDRLADKDSDVMDHASINETTIIEVARPPLADCNLRDTEHENDEIPTTKEVQDDAHEMISEEIDEQISNEVRASFKENLDHEETLTKAVDHIEKSQDTVDEAGPIDYEQSPPSPQADKPLQHALIQEADNVADSEDSEDEWNYYRVDPNKDKESAAPVDEPRETRNEFENENPTSPVEDAEPKIHSEDIEEDIKCEDPKDDSSELINTDINAEDKEKESKEEENLLVEEQDKSKDMDFQLNPDAAEFIPVSPQFTAPKRNLQDFPVSGSPFKRISQMDDIQIPSESEFEKEVCQRPREVESEDKKYRNGDHVQQGDFTDYINDQQKTASFINTLDDSEISSTKAEYGDADSTSFLTATEFHRTGISTVDDSFSSTERDYDIAKDPMAMSFTPSDFEAAFDKGVDLNAVHDLSNSDLDENNCDMEKEEERSQCEEPKYEFINNLECEQPTESELPPQESKVSEKPAELLNLSSQQEECEDTFIKHMDKPQETIDLLNLQTSPSMMMEQQEIIKDDHSPLTENYSTEFESEKEPVSVDNEQLLSPSSVDIDKTKPIDEASDDALPTDLQKEASTKEIDTPSSLSPVPDGIENDLTTPAESAEVPSAPIQCSLHADAPEFMPGEQYNFHSYSVETNEVHQSPMETGDIYQARSTEISSAYQPYSTETNDPFEINKSTLLDEDEQSEQKKELVVPMDTKPTEEKLLVFAEEEETCVKGQVYSELTPPLSPHEVEEEQSQNIADLICPIQPTEEKLDEIESKGPMEADILETKPEEEIESAKEAVLSLSESMQEFTGLESQLQPKEEEILESCVVPEAEVEVPMKEELKMEIKSEEIIEPIMVEEEYKVVEKQEVEEVPSLTKELLEVEKAVEVVESIETVQPGEDMKVEETTESKATEIAAAAATAVAATGIIAAAATTSGTSAIQSKTKAKTTSKSTKTTSKTTTPKSTPTSPSKTSISSSKTSTTTAKKSTTALNRPKDLDTLKKPAVSSTSVKTSPLKATSKTATTTTSKPTTRTSSGTAAKPKPTTLSSKPAVEKKATPNGDVKPLSKPATSTKAASKTPSATKTTLVKASTSTTRTLTGTSTTKPRPATATTTTKTNTTAKSAAVTTTTSSSARPKTAPNVGSTMKTTARASTPKSPMIDKQVKETANKQISMARTSTVSKTRHSGSNSTTSMVRRVSSTTKTTTASQVKKTSTVSKTSGKTSVGAKTPTDKGKVLQNGLSEKVEINTIIDDVPKKDVSPVITPNDNQLIMTSD